MAVNSSMSFVVSCRTTVLYILCGERKLSELMTCTVYEILNGMLHCKSLRSELEKNNLEKTAANIEWHLPTEVLHVYIAAVTLL